MLKPKPRAGELTTQYYSWVKPTVGASDDAWGGYINADLDGIDSTVKGVSSVANAAYPASNPSGYHDGGERHRKPWSLLAPMAGRPARALTPSTTAGLVGTTAADNANAGSVGEVIATNQTSPQTLTTGITANITSIALSAGDWDVCGEVWYSVLEPARPPRDSPPCQSAMSALRRPALHPNQRAARQPC